MSLLIGRNNVGKTSAYAPLLLLLQTLQARNPRTGLLLRGDLMDFGSYADVVTDHQTARMLSFYLDIEGGREIPNLLERPEVGRPAALEVTFSQGDASPATLHKSVVFDEKQRVIVSRTRRSDDSFKVHSPLLPQNKDVGRPFKEVTQLRRQLESEEPTNFLFSGSSGIRLPRAWRRDKERWEKVQEWYQAASDIYDTYWTINTRVSEALKALPTSVRFVTLRSDPTSSRPSRLPM